jgi:beta-N-acetylhexosaminidase
MKGVAGDGSAARRRALRRRRRHGAGRSPAAVRSIVRAVEEGELDETRLDLSVRRILDAKARLGLPARRLVDPLAARRAVGRPEDQERADEIARRSITVVRNRGGVLPLASEAPLRLLHLVLSSESAGPSAGSIPAKSQARRRADTRRLGPLMPPSATDEIVAAAPGYSHVLDLGYVPVISGKGSVAMDASHAALVERLARGPTPVAVASFGNPYILAQFPSAPVYLCAYGANESGQRAAIGALFGEFATAGKLPVTIPGLAALGDGLEIPRRSQSLVASTPQEAGFRATAIDDLRALLDGYVARAPSRRRAGGRLPGPAARPDSVRAPELRPRCRGGDRRHAS